MELFDTHAHLTETEFDDDRAAMIERAAAAGVTRMIAVGITAASTRQAIELTRQHPFSIWPTAGIHPNYCGQAAAGDWDAVVEMTKDFSVVGLGETGLDNHWDYTPFEMQQDYFDRHLRLSHETGLPFIVHCREAEAEVLAMLRDAHQRGPLKGVMHSFTGDEQLAAECLAMGMHISFAGMVTFKKSDELRRVAATIPAERLLIETDSPYLSPHPLRGKRNEPANLVHTAAAVALARGVDVEQLAELTTKNAKQFFRVP